MAAYNKAGDTVIRITDPLGYETVIRAKNLIVNFHQYQEEVTGFSIRGDMVEAVRNQRSRDNLHIDKMAAAAYMSADWITW